MVVIVIALTLIQNQNNADYNLDKYGILFVASHLRQRGQVLGSQLQHCPQAFPGVSANLVGKQAVGSPLTTIIIDR